MVGLNITGDLFDRCLTTWGSPREKTSIIPLYFKELSWRCLLDGCLIKGFGTGISVLEHPPRTLAEVANVIGKPVRVVERACANLADAGKLRYAGPKQGGHREGLE